MLCLLCFHTRSCLLPLFAPPPRFLEGSLCKTMKSPDNNRQLLRGPVVQQDSLQEIERGVLPFFLPSPAFTVSTPDGMRRAKKIMTINNTTTYNVHQAQLLPLHLTVWKRLWCTKAAPKIMKCGGSWLMAGKVQTLHWTLPTRLFSTQAMSVPRRRGDGRNRGSLLCSIWASGQAALGGLVFALLNRSDVPQGKGKVFTVLTH